MGTKEQGLTSFAASDPLGRGCVIRDGWAYAGSDDPSDDQPLIYMRVRTALPDTSSPAFDPDALAAIFNGAFAAPVTYQQYSMSIDGPGMAWRWWWPCPSWSGWPTQWEEWNDNPSRDARPTYAAPAAGYMKFTEDGGDAELIVRAGPAQT